MFLRPPLLSKSRISRWRLSPLRRRLQKRAASNYGLVDRRMLRNRTWLSRLRVRRLDHYSKRHPILLCYSVDSMKFRIYKDHHFEIYAKCKLQRMLIHNVNRWKHYVALPFDIEVLQTLRSHRCWKCFIFCSNFCFNCRLFAAVIKGVNSKKVCNV